MLTSGAFIAVSIFTFLSAAIVAVYAATRADGSRLERRLNDLALEARIADPTFEDDEERFEGLGRMLLSWALARLPQPDADTPAGAKLMRTLSHAGFYGAHAVRMFQIARIGCGVLGAIGAFVGARLMGQPTALEVLSPLAGAMLTSLVPALLLARRARRRQLAIGRELSDVLDLLVVCVESGLGIFEAIRTVGSETERQGHTLGAELSMLSAEISAGSTLGQGMRALAERTGVADIRTLAAVLIQSERLGSQMAPALRASSDSMRTKRRLRAEEAAQKSAIKMLIPLVLFVLPAMMMVILGPAVIQVLQNLRH